MNPPSFLQNLLPNAPLFDDKIRLQVMEVLTPLAQNPSQVRRSLCNGGMVWPTEGLIKEPSMHHVKSDGKNMCMYYVCNVMSCHVMLCYVNVM